MAFHSRAGGQLAKIAATPWTGPEAPVKNAALRLAESGAPVRGAPVREEPRQPAAVSSLKEECGAVKPLSKEEDFARLPHLPCLL